MKEMGSSLDGSGLGQVDSMDKCVSPFGHSHTLVGSYDIDMGYSGGARSFQSRRTI